MLRSEYPAPQFQQPMAAPMDVMHSIEELSLIGCVDSMPVMQATRRIRAPTSMATRPRIGKTMNFEPHPREFQARKERPLRAKPEIIIQAPRKYSGAPKIRMPPAAVTPLTLIANLDTPDLKMKARAVELLRTEIRSEPVVPMNTAIRVVLQASLDLGRPYDTNMLASTLNVTRSLVMQSLRKYYQDFMEQSLFTEAHFVPTYLWLYGLSSDPKNVAAVNRAIEFSGAGEPGSRSVFAIARDFVILFASEVAFAKEESVGLASATSIMNGIKAPKEVPEVFLEMTNTFLYRARMTGRAVIKTKAGLLGDRDGTVASLFD